MEVGEPDSKREGTPRILEVYEIAKAIGRAIRICERPDLLGRRRMLLIGMIAFTVFSFLIGINSTLGLFVVLRGLQGISSAVMSPAALSIVLTTFDERHDRSRALGYWSMVATAAQP